MLGDGGYTDIQSCLVTWLYRDTVMLGDGGYTEIQSVLVRT